MAFRFYQITKHEIPVQNDKNLKIVDVRYMLQTVQTCLMIIQNKLKNVIWFVALDCFHGHMAIVLRDVRGRDVNPIWDWDNQINAWKQILINR